MTVSDVCLKLGCFQSTSTYSILRDIALCALYKFMTYLLTYLRGAKLNAAPYGGLSSRSTCIVDASVLVNIGRGHHLVQIVH